MTLVGEQIGHYRLVRLIGQGGMGEVYLAEDTRISRQVAIKIVRGERQSHPSTNALREAERLFQREMKAISQLDHPNILSFYDFGEQAIANGCIIYMVMPYRHEGSLVDWLNRSGPNQLSSQDVRHIIAQAASALQHAHDRNIIHQDVKLSNFLVRLNADYPTRPDLFLADFGIAKIMSATSMASKSVRGTYAYMAPEQWNGDVVFASDQYALAVMTYQLLTGQLPFQGRSEQLMHQHLRVAPKPPSELNSRLSPAVNAVILRALAKISEGRFPTIRAFAIALQQALDYADQCAMLVMSQAEMLQGGSRAVVLSDGRQVTVVIPSDAQHGQVLHLPNLGALYYNGGPCGPLLLTLSVEQTTPDPSKGNVPPPSVSGSVVKALPSVTYINEPLPYIDNHEPVSPIVLTPPSSGSTPRFTWLAISWQRIRPSPETDERKQHSRWTRVPIFLRTVLVRMPIKQHVFLFITIALLLLIVSCGLIVALVNNTIANNHANAIATARSVTAATVQAQATSDAAANSTAVVVAANPDPYQPSGTLAFLDPLSQPDDAWSNYSDTSFGGQCRFVNGSYQVRQSSTNSIFNCDENTQYSNFAFEVKMVINQGDCGGIDIRDDISTGKGYIFQVCQDGTYGFYKYTSKSGSSSTTLASGNSSAIKQGTGQSNTIAVVANGSNFDLYVNSQKIDSASDGTYSQNYLGLVASVYNNPTTVTYQDARLWTIG